MNILEIWFILQHSIFIHLPITTYFQSIKILYLNDSIQPIACGVQRLPMKIYFLTLASNVSLKQNVEPVLTNLEAVLC